MTRRSIATVVAKRLERGRLGLPPPLAGCTPRKEWTMRSTKKAIATIVAATAAFASTAAASGPRDLPVSDLFTPPGHTTTLAPGTYQATKLPIPFRITTDAGWTGAQWKANVWSPYEIERRHLHCPRACQPPYFGWAALAKGGTSPGTPPRGFILVMAGFSPTPSAADTVTTLRTRGAGATYGQTSPTTIAGFAGVQFDGQVTGRRHVFVPFSPRTHKATGFPDAIETETGDVFRFIILNVRGKTVVVFVGSLAANATAFPAFLDDATSLLATVRFPQG